MPKNDPTAGKLNSAAGQTLFGKRDESPCSAPVGGHADAGKQRRPDDAERGGVVGIERVGRNIQDGAGRIDVELDQRSHRRVDIGAPPRGALADVDEGRIEARRVGPERRQQVEPDAISGVCSASVRWIIDPGHVRGTGVARDLGATKTKERTANVARRSKSGQPASAGAAQRAKEHRFDLVVSGVRRANRSPVFGGGRAEKRQPAVAPGRLRWAVVR